ncbi:MAG: anaerobic ribonucleoside-triphosphate reductase activating protein [Nanoarchaeota archaeon]|nr:anaerobic ribonucleoside-triphosphate reductase activating protein [Nanoarchaeota archaeon]
MQIRGFQKTSLIDYPEKICSVIFLSGCNFRCGYCHNPGLVIDDGSQDILEDYVINKLEERKGLVDSVCITGGEPTLHKDLPRFIKRIKDRKLKVKLDTNGSNPEMLKHLIDNKLLDFIAMDIKNVFEKYEQTINTKVNNDLLKESIKAVIRSGLEHEFRTTVLPKLHKKEDILKIAKSLAGANKYVLQQFVAAEKMLDKSYITEEKYNEEELEAIKNECSKYVKTEIRNI